MVSEAAASEDAHRAVDYLVSYDEVDEAWATWVAAVLEASGRSVRLRAWDAAPGTNLVVWISEQMRLARQTVAICSEAYFSSHWTSPEWASAMRSGKLLPIRVEDCQPPAVLTAIVFCDLHGVGEEVATQRLTEATGLAPVSRVSSGFPGRDKGRNESDEVSSTLTPNPPIWNVPLRLRTFTGRADIFDRLISALPSGLPVAVIALHGLGGVGKTQLAIEYAHRKRSEYGLVWWLNAENAGLLAEQFATLAGRLGLQASGSVEHDAAAALDALGGREDWLLVFDNAEEPGRVRRWMPAGGGHILLTSRNPAWGAVASRIEIDVMARPDTVDLLIRRVGGMEHSIANLLAEELGDLPLAVEQAAAYMETTGVAPRDYVTLFRARRDRMISRGIDLPTNRTVATVWSLSLDRIRESSPSAVRLLDVCAHMGPEPIPLAVLTYPLKRHPLSIRRVSVVARSDLDDTVGAVLTYSLARRDSEQDTLTVHRLVSAVISSQQSRRSNTRHSRTARRLLPEVAFSGIADQLATVVRAQWAAEVRRLDLRTPYLLPVSWRLAASELFGDWSTGSQPGTGGPTMLAARSAVQELSNVGGGLSELLGRIPTSRLVILGEPASGKTTLLTGLLMDMLARRTPGAPVPVLAPIHSREVSRQPLDDWLEQRLLRDYPFLDRRSRPAAPDSLAKSLLRAGLVFPLLDGLDETAPSTQATIIGQINDSLSIGGGFVLSCRSAEYRAMFRKDGVRLVGAAGIELCPPDPLAALAYLSAMAGPRTAARWEMIADVVASDSQHPLAMIFSSPLMVRIARGKYNGRSGEPSHIAPDPTELLDRNRFPNYEEIAKYLYHDLTAVWWADDDHAVGARTHGGFGALKAWIKGNGRQGL